MAHNLIYNGLDFKKPDKEFGDEQLQGAVQATEPSEYGGETKKKQQSDTTHTTRQIRYAPITKEEDAANEEKLNKFAISAMNYDISHPNGVALDQPLSTVMRMMLPEYIKYGMSEEDTKKLITQKYNEGNYSKKARRAERLRNKAQSQDGITAPDVVPTVQQNKQEQSTSQDNQRFGLKQGFGGYGKQQKPFDVNTPEQQNTPQQKPTTHFRTIDDYWKESGLDKIPELQTTTNKKREERAKQQQKYYNLAQGLRTLVQSVGAANGAYETKFKPDRVTPRVQAELARIRDAKDADERRVKLANWNNELKKSLAKIGIMQNEENQKYTDRRADNRNQYLKDVYGYKNSPEYLTEKDKLDRKLKLDIQKSKNQTDINIAEKEYQNNLDKLDKLYPNGKPVVTKTTKPAMTIIKDGKSVDLTQSQVEDEVFSYLQKMKQLSETNADEYAKLPLEIRKAIEMNEKLTAAQKRDIVRMIYADTNDSLYPDEEQLYPEN